MKYFEPYVKSAIIDAGWYDGRIVNCNQYESLVKSEGYSWFTESQEFLSEFGGLSIKLSRSVGNITDFNFDVACCIKDFDARWVFEEYAARIGKQAFCPLGTAYSSHMMLFMSEEGKFYGGYDDLLFFIGYNKYDFINNLASQKVVEI